MTDFNYKRGDHLKFTATDEDGRKGTKHIYLHQSEDGQLVTYNPFDPRCPVVPFNESFVQNFFDLGGTIEVYKTAEQAVPTEPGEYEDVARYFMTESVRGTEREIAVKALGEWYQETPWVLNEDGTWTSPDGSTQPADANWTLAVEGFLFVPWSERDTIPERFDFRTEFGILADIFPL